MQSLAMLDAILSPDWQYRYYSFNDYWSADEAMASMRNGSGDDYFALFSAAGGILKGFAHEALMSPYGFVPPKVWPGVLDTVPSAFAAFLTELAFSRQDTTFCIWRTYQDASWQRGDIRFGEGADPDGSAKLLSLLDGNPQTYQEWAEDYYEQTINLDAVTHIYKHHALTPEVVATLNPDCDFQVLAADIKEIGYKSAPLTK
jgi:hypothetical protein